MIKHLLSGIALLGLISRAMGQVPLDQLGGPVCGMVDPATRAQVAVSPVFTRVNVVVTDAIAQAVVTQTFVNPFLEPSEAVYMFPLPDQGSVHGMKYRYRDSLYQARIVEQAEAKRIYEAISRSGGQAALLLQERPNIFQQRIANMGAGETTMVEIRLSMTLKYVDGELELAFPTLIGPRYGSGAPAAPGSWNPPENRAGPGFQFNVLLQSGVELTNITSPSHPIEVGEFGAMKPALVERQVMGPEVKAAAAFTRGVLLKTQTTYPNRDFVLRMKRAKTAQDFSLATYRDAQAAPDGGDPGYFALSLYPDPSLFQGVRPDLDLVLLVDASGSQTGWPLEREKEIALDIFSRLTPRDDLTVLSFADGVHYAFGAPAPAPATAGNLAAAGNFVRGLTARGGTRLLDAVRASLATPAREGKKRLYIFLTDGFIADEMSILSAIGNHATRPTIFTFGAGNSLNRYFLEECAKVGNGFAAPLVQGDATGPLVASAWARIEAPQLENIQVDFGTLAVTQVLYPVSRKLYRGLPFVVLGRYARGGTYTVTLSADRNGKPVTFSRTVVVSGEETPAWSVPKLWARERIGQLMLDQGLTGNYKEAIVRVSVDYQVLSSYTAFLASNPQSVEVAPGGGLPVEVFRDRAFAPVPRFEVSQRGGLLRFDWAGLEPIRDIRILDLQGRLIFTYRPGADRPSMQWVWDGRDAKGVKLPRGRFLLSVRTAKGVQTRPFEWAPES